LNHGYITDIKLYGTLSGIFSGIVIFVITFVFGINILFLNFLGKIPIYFWLIPLMTFFLFIHFNKRTNRKKINLIYSGIAIVTFIYLNSVLHWSVECCPEKYDSMYDWNASKGLTWIVDLPMVFIILIIQGLMFDFLREWNFRRRKKITLNIPSGG
jgi:hypothetical protein